jgi:hypothetical protein
MRLLQQQLSAHVHCACCPAPQARASFTQNYPSLAAQHKQHLSAHTTAQRSSSLLGLECLDPNIRQLQSLLAACDLSAGSGGLKSGLQQQHQQQGVQQGMQPLGSGQGAKSAVGAAGGAQTQALLAQAAAAAQKLETAQQVGLNAQWVWRCRSSQPGGWLIG